MNRRPIPPHIRRALIRMQKSTCQLCGAHGHKVIIEIDHIIPIARGGTNNFDNLQLLCRTCNRKKGTRIAAPTHLKMLPKPR